MLELITIVVEDYDRAISFFVEVLDFELIEDTPSLTNDGRAKRWVVVRPRAAQTGILPARPRHRLISYSPRETQSAMAMKTI